MTKRGDSRGGRENGARAARGAKGAAGGPPTTGLAGFALDSSEQKGKKAFATLAADRPSFRGFAAGAPVDIKKLDPETAALNHLNQAMASSAVKALVNPKVDSTASEFKSLGAERIPLTDTTVVKFRQTLNKIPVYGSLVSVELGKGNDCLAINSSLGTPAGVNHVASVSPAEALAVAAKAAGDAKASLTQTPRLYYYYDQHANRWRLAYIVENVPAQGRKPLSNGHRDAALKDYVVDAHSGKLLADLPRIAMMASTQEVVKDALNHRRKITVEVIGGDRRRMRDDTLGLTTYDFAFKDPEKQRLLLPGNVYEKPPTPWPLEAVGAHANGEVVAKFLRDVLKRNNIDNNGGEMVSSVNCWDRSEGEIPPREWKNAYWNGDQMVYGQIKFPDGSFYSTASMLEVVGHEMFHGVTDYTARLEYRTQPGALNESYSDIFGVLIANGSKSISRWSWEVGVGFDGPNTVLRNMADPTLCGQPRHMRDYMTSTPPYTRANDYGHVHGNSGIHNYAAYKIMTARTGGRYVFTPRQLAGLFYIALTVHLSRTSEFADSRRGVVQAARSLFRNDGAAALARKVAAVEQGFTAAGIV